MSGNDRVQTLLAAFRHVGMPLMQALTEATGAEEQNTGASSATKLNGDAFSSLIDSTIVLSRELAGQLAGDEGKMDPAVRWALAGSASQVVAANYRASAKALTTEEAKRLAEVASTLQTQFKSQIPQDSEAMPNVAAAFRSKMMEAMVPVIGAVAQYSFGRAEHSLLAEVAERLVKTADQMTRALAPAGTSTEDWRLLCWNILRSAGQIYAECHYAEADRLLYMNPEERSVYFAQHGNVVPMTQVWQAFNQRMAMLATLANYLEVPEEAHLETQGWR